MTWGWRGRQWPLAEPVVLRPGAADLLRRDLGRLGMPLRVSTEEAFHMLTLRSPAPRRPPAAGAGWTSGSAEEARNWRARCAPTQGRWRHWLRSGGQGCSSRRWPSGCPVPADRARAAAGKMAVAWPRRGTRRGADPALGEAGHLGEVSGPSSSQSSKPCRCPAACRALPGARSDALQLQTFAAAQPVQAGEELLRSRASRASNSRGDSAPRPARPAAARCGVRQTTLSRRGMVSPARAIATWSPGRASSVCQRRDEPRLTRAMRAASSCTPVADAAAA
jgi:hypothetical protein